MPPIPLAAALLAAVLGATPPAPQAPEVGAPRWIADTGG